MNPSECRLCALSPGESGVISHFEPGFSMYQRLTDLGFAEGAVVRCLLRSPCGDPCAYRVRGITLALRQRDARSIWVRTLHETERNV